MSAEQSDGAPADSDLVVDTLRQLVTVLGALLGTPAGVKAVSDAKECRSLPSVSKALRRLWFDTPLSEAWDTKEEAVWACHLLAVSEGARAGILSFYGAGIIVCSVLIDFARSALEAKGLPLDEAWIGGICAVEQILRGRHFEQLQQWPADRRCGGGKTDLLCTSRLPSQVRRKLDLDGKKLSKVQMAGLGAFCLLPGGFTVGAGVVGVGLLYQKARQLMSNEPRETDPWKQIQAQCMTQAHALLRRKQCPIQVSYVPGQHGFPKVRVSLYSTKDPLCVIPAGGLNGDSSVLLEGGERCSLRPRSDANSFNMRVFKPALLDVALNDGVEVKRGDQIAIVMTASGEVRFFADQRTSSAASSNSPVRPDSSLSAPLAHDEFLDSPPRDLQVQDTGSPNHTPATISDAGYPTSTGEPRPGDATKLDITEVHGPDRPEATCEDLNLAEFRALAAKLDTTSPTRDRAVLVRLGP